MMPEGKNEEWKSCCFTCDPHAATFVAQLIFSIAAFILAATMLALKDTTNQSLWVGILTLLLGVWVPQPTVPKTINFS